MSGNKPNPISLMVMIQDLRAQRRAQAEELQRTDELIGRYVERLNNLMPPKKRRKPC